MKVKKYIKIKPIVEDLTGIDYSSAIVQHINGQNTKGAPHPGLTETEKAALKPAFREVAKMLNDEADSM